MRNPSFISFLISHVLTLHLFQCVLFFSSPAAVEGLEALPRPSFRQVLAPLAPLVPRPRIPTAPAAEVALSVLPGFAAAARAHTQDAAATYEERGGLRQNLQQTHAVFLN